MISYARDTGRLDDYASSFLRGVWADGIDGKTEKGLAHIVERSGLDWEKARSHLRDSDWSENVEGNRSALTGLGLWGVPSFRLGDTAFWGQDRLWLVDNQFSRAR